MLAPVAHPAVHNFLDLTGKRFGRLLAKHYVGRVDDKPSWLCVCDCGKELVAVTKQLTRGQTQSCGCLLIERTKAANTKHGGKGTRLYRIWSGMLTRCRNKASKDYYRYGGAGISVCDEWLDFTQFQSDMGNPPTVLHSLDRIDGKKGYSKDNCRWATTREQAFNRRTTVAVNLNGRMVAAAEVDRVLGLYKGATARRIRRERGEL